MIGACDIWVKISLEVVPEERVDRIEGILQIDFRYCIPKSSNSAEVKVRPVEVLLNLFTCLFLDNNLVEYIIHDELILLN